jgi:3-hydroxyisobutyrate dehydrogenase-like beta-hydroxyacid dehydrogenase
MGRPMVDRLVAAGHEVTAFVRKAEVAAELVAAGVQVSTSVAGVADGADIVAVCLFSDEQVSQVLTAEVVNALPEGSYLVNHVTGSPTLAEELATRLAGRAHYVDAPMSGTAADIAAGKLTLLIGATAADFEAVQPVLAAYSDPIVHVGGVGDGQRIKLLNNLLFTTHLRIALEAATLAETIGITPVQVARVLRTCSGNSYALALLEHLDAATISQSARPYLAKDVAVVREVAAGLGVDLGLLGSMAEWVGTP